jgi:hypothetical protein
MTEKEYFTNKTLLSSVVIIIIFFNVGVIGECTGKHEVFYQRGLSEAQYGCSFLLCMLLGYGPWNSLVSSSALICRFQCS